MYSYNMQTINLEISLSTMKFADKFDSQRISIASIRTEQETKETRKLKIADYKKSQDIRITTEDFLYTP